MPSTYQSLFILLESLFSVENNSKSCGDLELGWPETKLKLI